MGNAFTSTILPRINFTIFNLKMPEKKGAAKAKAAPSHPPYSKMITDAIVAEGGKEKFAKRGLYSGKWETETERETFRVTVLSRSNSCSDSGSK